MAQSTPKNVHKSTLSNGLRVLSEFMPHLRSVSLGIWLNAGSRHEEQPESGITHFIEHMVFKGTRNYSARDIAYTIDGLGGHLDAFTSKEITAFTCKVLDEHCPQALDIIADMVQYPKFDEQDIEREKGVVLEELKMDEDNPDYLLGQVFTRNFWQGHAMGRPVIGFPDTIRSFYRSQLQHFFSTTFCVGNMLLTAAGNIEHDQLVQMAEERLQGLPAKKAPESIPAPNANPEIVLHDKPSLEQVNLSLGIGTFSISDPRRYAGFVLCTLLGGGFSSRLFQKIREESGLAYSVYSDLGLYSDTGCILVGAGTSLDSLQRVIDYTLNEFRDLKERLVPETELRRAKDHLKGSLVLSLESTGSRMNNLARQETSHGRIRSLDEIKDEVEAVTAVGVQELANEWFQQDKIALAVLGNLQGLQIGREQLAC